MEDVDHYCNENYDNVSEGASCWYVPEVTKDVGAKFFRNIKERNSTYNRHKMALKAEIPAPSLGTKFSMTVSIPLMKIEIYGYLTEHVYVDFEDVTIYNDDRKVEIIEDIANVFNIDFDDVDDHPGNWGVNNTGELVFIDFDDVSFEKL